MWVPYQRSPFIAPCTHTHTDIVVFNNPFHNKQGRYRKGHPKRIGGFCTDGQIIIVKQTNKHRDRDGTATADTGTTGKRYNTGNNL